MAKSRRNAPPTPADLDQLIHERLRLGIVCTLAVHDALTFTELRDLMQTTDGNLSVQARRLEEAGYITCQKRFEGRKPKTTYRLTTRGRNALEDYLQVLSEMLPPEMLPAGQRARGTVGLRAVTAES
jgi:DNA-binding MarR family transcriptional regulator